MLRALSISLLLGAGLSGCSQPCNQSQLCTIDDQNALCDGNEYVVCTANTLGKKVSCQQSSQTAVCTAAGWTFDNTPR